MSREAQIEFQTNINDFYEFLQQGLEIVFGQLVEQLMPFKWTEFFVNFNDTEMLASIDYLPERVRRAINHEELVLEFAQVKLYLKTGVKCYREAVPIATSWNGAMTHIPYEKRWRQVFSNQTRHPNLALIVNYLFALPNGFYGHIQEVYDDVQNFWTQELERNPEHPELGTVKTAISMRHNEIAEKQSEIVAMLKDKNPKKAIAEHVNKQKSVSVIYGQPKLKKR